MMKIGVIQLFEKLNIMGLGDFFKARNDDWKLLYCPFSLNDAMIGNIYLNNIRDAFDNTNQDEEFSMKTRDEYAKDDYILQYIRRTFIQDRWDEALTNAVKPILFGRYLDFHEIRIINESRRDPPLTVDQRVKLICDWVGDCDFILLDITGCLRFDVEKSWTTIEDTIQAPNIDRLLCFAFDWRPKANAQRQWDEKLKMLKGMCETVFLDSAYIEKRVIENDAKTSLTKWIDYNICLYNEEIQNTIRTNIETRRVSDTRAGL